MTDMKPPDGVNLADFWVVEISGWEWLYVFNELTERYKLTEKPGALFVDIATDGSAASFVFKKSEVPVSEMMRVTGRPMSELEGSTLVRLSVKPTPNLPLPNVGYWGTA